jgi:hypothetical protein
MTILTLRFRQWLLDNHPDILPLIMIGHMELMTSEMWHDYERWCFTPEGREYFED